MQLAGGSRAREHSLVFHVDLVKSRLHGPGLVQEREVPGAGSLREDHGALLGGGGELAALAEGLQGVLSAHGLHDRRGHVYWENSKRVTGLVVLAFNISTETHTLKHIPTDQDLKIFPRLLSNIGTDSLKEESRLAANS